MSKNTESRADRVRRYTYNALVTIITSLDEGSLAVGSFGHKVRVTKFADAKKLKLGKMNAQYVFMSRAGAPKTELALWKEVRAAVGRFASRKAAETFIKEL